MSTYDVAVVGRGAVGSAAALAFGRAGRRVALIGPLPTSAPSATTFGPETPLAAADWDQRVYALSPASRSLLMELGVWQLLDPSRVAPVHDMRILQPPGSSGAVLPEVHLDAYRARVEALAWIVENRELQGALDRALAALPGPSTLTRVDAEVNSLTLPLTAEDRRAASLGLGSGGRLSASLVIGADGIGSRLREFAAIGHLVRDYEQTAIVANFEADRPHRDCAWQWFGSFGVVALLPLPSDDLGFGRSRVSLVWSAPRDRAAQVLVAGGEALAGEVASMTGSQMGRLRMITPPASFPLRMVRCRQVIKPAFILIGDAAHAIHPMAGQGMNLGFGDVRGLMDYVMPPVGHLSPQRSFNSSAQSSTLARAGYAEQAQSAAPHWLDLRRYERSRKEPVAAMQLALDGLHRAFGPLPGPLAGVRDIGWSMVARSAWLRRLMIAHAVS
jgi:2-octaprenylphenol hydroxylase